MDIYYNPEHGLVGMIIMLLFYMLIGIWFWFDLSFDFVVSFMRPRSTHLGPIKCRYCNSIKTMTFEKYVRIDYPSTYGCCHQCCRTWRIT